MKYKVLKKNIRNIVIINNNNNTSMLNSFLQLSACGASNIYLNDITDKVGS